MNEEYYINLIYKSIDGELLPEERQELDSWLQESEENQNAFEAVKLAWTHSDISIETPEVDLDTEFAALESKIDSSEEEDDNVIPISRSEPGKPKFNWLSIAASIVLLLGIGYFFNEYTDNAKWETIKTGSEVETIILADNSEVQLNANSELKYLKEFIGSERLLKLEGEAFFKVTPNADKPFIIETNKEKIQVLGTSFNVRAYEDEKESSVFVATGKVKFEVKDSHENLILTPNNKGVFNHENQSLTKIDKASGNSVSWIQKELIFIDTPLDEVISDVEQFYNVSIKVENKELLKCIMTASFKDAEREEVFETLSILFAAEFKETSSNEYILTGGSCE